MTRSPATVGYVPWLLNRLSALALVVLLAVHIGVQVYPSYGFVAILQWGWYGSLLDLTLALVLLHGILGVRSTVLETSLPRRAKTLAIWGVGGLALLLFVYRVLG
jgi:succinate dehydrogenase hydrophobic anchor subunit